MPLANQRLYDVLTRHQIYLEGVKAYQAQQHSKVMRELATELKRMLSSLHYDTLGDMPKTKLMAFISAVRKMQSRIYSTYQDDVLKMLENFVSADFKMTAFIAEHIEFEINATDEEIADANIPAKAPEVETPIEEDEKATPLFGIALLAGTATALAGLLSTVKVSPLPANGALPLTFLAQSNLAAASAVENQIRMAYANKLTPSQTIAAIVGTKANNFNDAVLARSHRGAVAVVNTLLQHASSIVHAATFSAFFTSYEWVSVIDNKTTAICLSRDGKEYRYGDGPLPPAHIGCRSKTVPVVGKQTAPDSYFSWLKTQPLSFLIDILGAERAQALKAGKLKAKDFASFQEATPIPIEKFSGKLQMILQP
jgi:SPP1 gp7 family putative phage head morphogenesis protein